MFTMLCYKPDCQPPKYLQGYFVLIVHSLMALPMCLGMLAKAAVWGVTVAGCVGCHSRGCVGGVTIADILTGSYLASTSMTATAATELATTRKEVKYVELSKTHHFVPLAFESLDPIGSKTTDF